jgi:hypothetical protein
MRLLPDWQVDGATPARLASASVVGSAAGVADLGQQPSGANGAGARQAGEHLRVGVRVQPLGDLVGQHGDLLDQRRNATSNARVTCSAAAPASPVAPRGAAVIRACIFSGVVLPQ